MTTKLDNAFFQRMHEQAVASPRKRSFFNLHENHDAPVQRLCLCFTKGTYVRPHVHPQNNKWELLLVLRGKLRLTIFDAEGAVLETLVLGEGESVDSTELNGIEMSPNTCHTLSPLTDAAYVMEVKEGPYTPSVESDFAAWAPKEGEPEANDFLHWLDSAQPGDRYTR